jgi:hypothetical protein
VVVIVRAKARTYLRGKSKGKSKGRSKGKSKGKGKGKGKGKDVPGAKAPMSGWVVIVRAKARTYLRGKCNGNGNSNSKCNGNSNSKSKSKGNGSGSGSGKSKGNDNGNGNGQYRGPSLRSRMTAKNMQRQRPGLNEGGIKRGSGCRRRG